MKEKELLRLKHEIEVCSQCRLHRSRVHPVVGEGPLNAKIMLIGEAPGYWEDQKGQPFVGAAGKILDELLSAAKLSRENVYITNVVKCRPPGNRPPKPDEINICTSRYLERQYNLIAPKLICAMGNYAAKYVLTMFSFKSGNMGEIHGRIFRRPDIVVIPLYHPAAALHKPPLIGTLKEDWDKVRVQIGRLI